MPEWLSTVDLGQVITVVTILIAGFVAVRSFTRTFTPLMQLIDEMIGRPAQYGMRARPGVLERLTELENTQTIILGKISELKEIVKESVR